MRAPDARATTAVTGVTCEYLTDPLGIDAANPRLAWKIVSDKRAVKQTAYEVIVASTEENLKKGQGDLWDSGKVASDATAQIAYAGSALRSSEICYWKVRVWDNSGHTIDSDAATWEMGLLQLSDWSAQWIARTTDTSALSTPLLRHNFSLDGKIKRARAYVSGLGYYELSLNGKRVGDDLLAPGYTRYDRRVLYETYDVTDLLRSGRNAVGAMLGNGWYNVQEKAAWNFDVAPWRAAPKLLCQLRVEMDDGRILTVASDGTWKTADSPITYSSIYGGENYDARLEIPDWDRGGFDDSSWQPALVVDAPKGKIAAQAMCPIALDQTIAPVAVTEPEPGVFVFDAGQNLTGNAELRISGPAGTQIKMRYAEKLKSNGRVDQSNIAVHVLRFGKDQQFQTDNYTLKGQDTERWHARFNYNGFQYVEVTGAPGKLTADNLRIRYFHSAVPLTGSFACSNPLMNKIWIAGRWSYLSNLFGIPTDCPHREKNGWMGDAQVGCEQGLFYADGITVYQKWINDIDDEQRPTGAIPGIVPTNGEWGYGFGSGPAWDSAFLLIPWHLYEYYGDDSILKAHYAGFKRYVDYLTTRATFGSPKNAPANTNIVQIGLGDWSPWKAKTPVAVTDTGYYYRDARIVSAVARMLGKADDAAKYDGLADQIRASFNATFYNPATGNYSDGSQTALGTALYQGLTEPQNDNKIVANLVGAIYRNDGHLDFGLLGSKYVLNTLTDHGHADVAYTVASQKTQPGWGWWIEQGATTLWESWGAGESHNHTFLGDVDAWMMKTLAGINADPAAPGFSHIRITPHVVGDLTSAKASYESIRGTIVSDWKAEGGVFSIDLTIPANTMATVVLPIGDLRQLREGNTIANAAPGVFGVHSSDGANATLSLGSGTYHFSGPLAKQAR